MSDLVLARNCCLARMLPGEAENGVGMNRSVREGKKCAKRFELSNGLDTALYKNYLYLFFTWMTAHACMSVVLCLQAMAVRRLSDLTIVL